MTYCHPRNMNDHTLEHELGTLLRIYLDRRGLGQVQIRALIAEVEGTFLEARAAGRTLTDLLGTAILPVEAGNDKREQTP